MFRSLLVVVLAISLVSVANAQPALKWYKGNTHTHTLNSDGDSAPDEVVRWYREHGYNFLFITDHEFITNAAPLNALFAKPDSFLVIQGQEVTDSAEGKPYHLNGLGMTKVVMPNKLPTAVETLQKNINDVVATGAVVQINHPNFGWALTADHLKKLSGYSLLEIHNGHFLVNNLGGGGSPSAEELWDSVLSSGKKVFAIADDDVHSIKRVGDPNSATPGRGWIYVRAATLSEESILTALKQGNFYASTGVELTDLKSGANELTLNIRVQGSSRYRTLFIGQNGKLLAESVKNPATYRANGNEGYVRAKVIDSNGKMAWTQPLFLPSR